MANHLCSSAKKTDMTTTYRMNTMRPDDDTSRSEGSLKATGEERRKSPSKTSQNDVAEPKPP